MSDESLEDCARAMLERAGVPDVHDYSAGDLVEIANMLDEVARLRAALDNVRLLSGRIAYRNEGWAIKLRQFCADAGVTGSPFRAPADQIGSNATTTGPLPTSASAGK